MVYTWCQPQWHKDIDPGSKLKLLYRFHFLNAAKILQISFQSPQNFASQKKYNTKKKIFNSPSKKSLEMSSAFKSILCSGEEKALGCKMCPYSCSFPSQLKKHMLTHSGEKPFTCNQCSYKCTTSGSLSDNTQWREEFHLP